MVGFLELSANYGGKGYSDASGAVAALNKHIEDSYKRIPDTLRNELGRYLKRVQSELVSKHSAPYSGARGGDSLSRRSGGGLRSIMESIKVQSGSEIQDVSGRIGGNYYMRVHEYGATITPRTAKYLTIPMPAALDARGIPKKRSAREWSNTFVAPTKSGLMIFQKRASRIVPLYLLKKSVKIPARLGMYDKLGDMGGYLLSNVIKEVDKIF